VRLVRTGETDAFNAAARDSGLDRFAVFPSRTPHDDRLVVDYVHPLAGNESVLGFDLGTEDVRRASVERARDTGAPVASRRIDLIQSDEVDVGVLLLLAVYESSRVPPDSAQRRATFSGVVAGVFRLRGMLDGVTDHGAATSVEVYDAGPVGTRRRTPTAETLLYDSDATPSAPDNLAAAPHFTDIDVAGRRWRVFVDPPTAPPGENRWRSVERRGRAPHRGCRDRRAGAGKVAHPCHHAGPPDDRRTVTVD
jgi:CHASE1-domain containing sensor protein